jgi:hypothetical protein
MKKLRLFLVSLTLLSVFVFLTAFAIMLPSPAMANKFKGACYCSKTGSQGKRESLLI